MYDTAFECLVIPAVQYLKIPAAEYLGIPAVESPKDPVSVSHEYEAACLGQCDHYFDQSEICSPEKRVFKSWTIHEPVYYICTALTEKLFFCDYTNFPPVICREPNNEDIRI